jgi:hypothetical protein
LRTGVLNRFWCTEEISSRALFRPSDVDFQRRSGHLAGTRSNFARAFSTFAKSKRTT